MHISNLNSTVPRNLRVAVSIHYPLFEPIFIGASSFALLRCIWMANILLPNFLVLRYFQRCSFVTTSQHLSNLCSQQRYSIMYSTFATIRAPVVSFVHFFITASIGILRVNNRPIYLSGSVRHRLPAFPLSQQQSQTSHVLRTTRN